MPSFGIPSTLALKGQYVRLEPLAPHHAADLAIAAQAPIFNFFLGAYPQGPLESDGLRFVHACLAEPNRRPFAVIDVSTGSAIGSTSYLDIRPAHRSLEIGATWINPSYHGTMINPEMKFLLLEHAFEELSCVRVTIKTDSRNEQSQAAIQKLGAIREGVLRNMGILPDGYVRDAVMYSILPDEWPEVRERLLHRLANQPKT